MGGGAGEATGWRRSSRAAHACHTLNGGSQGAGTDANVYVDIKGAQRSTGRQWLKNASYNLFERGQADEFEVRR